MRTDSTRVAPLVYDVPAPNGRSPARLRLQAHVNRIGSRTSRASLVRRSLAIGDAAALAAACCCTALLTDVGEPGRLLAAVALFAASLPVWLVLGRAYGLYDADVTRIGNTTADDGVRLFHVVVVGTTALYAGARLAGLDATPELFALHGALALLSIAFARACTRAVMRRRPRYAQKTVIVGAGTTGQLVASKVIHGPRGIDLVGFVDTEPPQPDDPSYLGGPERLSTVIGLHDVERVIVALPSASGAELLTLLQTLDHLPVQVDVVPPLFDALGPRAELHDLCGLPLVGLPRRRRTQAAILCKRLLDVAGSAVLVVALAPVLVAIALAVKLTSPGPVLYRGARIGRNGTRFKLIKFRTMRIEYCRGADYGGEDAEAAFRGLMTDPAQRAQFERAHKLADDPRITPIGELLRRTSLDELPQLFNVLSGELALVGPRPIPVDDYDELLSGGTAELPTEAYWTIPDLRPGMTGYWQINGRSSTSYEERLRLDNVYATSWSLGLDLAILAKTAPAVFDRRNTC